MTGKLPDIFSELMAACLRGSCPARMGVALSGGGDSMALLALMGDWVRAEGVELAAVTVDHGLRPEAAEEAAFAGRAAAALGIAHDVVQWRGWDGGGNLQDAARQARRALIAEWAERRAITMVALAHTEDDQAETVLLRLARGSGVDGLAAMAPRHRAEGITWIRPLLGVPRATLRDELRARGLSWIDDPSNDDTEFDRIKARQALAALEPLGLTRRGLADSARQMARARAALELQTHAAAGELTEVTQTGDVLIRLPGLMAQPAEIRLRLVAHALRWVASAPYRPRLRALERLIGAAAEGQGGTLHGCLTSVADETLRIGREAASLDGVTAPIGALWDRRWRITGPADDTLHVGVLGEAGLAACANWRDTGHPRHALIATPALWRGAELIAAPLAGQPAEWAAELAEGPASFRLSLLSH